MSCWQAVSVFQNECGYQVHPFCRAGPGRGAETWPTGLGL